MCWTMSQVYNQPLLTFMSFLLFSPVDLSPPGQTFYHTFLKFCSFCCWDHNSSKTKSLSGGVLLLIKSSPVPHRDAVKMESSVQGEKEEFQCLTAGGDVKCQSEESQSLFLTEIEHFSTLFFVFLVPVNVLWLLLVPVLKNVDTINIYRPILEFSFVHSPIRLVSLTLCTKLEGSVIYWRGHCSVGHEEDMTMRTPGRKMPYLLI